MNLNIFTDIFGLTRAAVWQKVAVQIIGGGRAQTATKMVNKNYSKKNYEQIEVCSKLRICSLTLKMFGVAGQAGMIWSM